MSDQPQCEPWVNLELPEIGEVNKALHCLLLETDGSIVNDIQGKVSRAFSAVWAAAKKMEPMPLNHRVNEDIVAMACFAYKHQAGKPDDSPLDIEQVNRMNAALEAVLPTIIDRVKRGFL